METDTRKNTKKKNTFTAFSRHSLAELHTETLCSLYLKHPHKGLEWYDGEIWLVVVNW